MPVFCRMVSRVDAEFGPSARDARIAASPLAALPLPSATASKPHTRYSSIVQKLHRALVYNFSSYYDGCVGGVAVDACTLR